MGTDKSLLAGVDTCKVLSHAAARGAELADLFAEEKSITLIELEAGQVERLIQGRRAGAGVRLIRSFRTAYSYSELIRTLPLLECADLVRSAAGGGKRRSLIIPRRRRRRFLLPVAEPPEMDVKNKVKLLFRADAAARRTDRRVQQVRVVYGDTVRRISIADSEGRLLDHVATYIFFHVTVIAADGHGLQVAHESRGGTMGWELFQEFDVGAVAETAAKRAVRNLVARPAPAGPMMVVLAAEAGGTMIHEAVGHGLEADLAEEGLSVYSGKLGRPVASPLITVMDDATLPGRRGSFRIDDEGIPAQATVLIEKGVLKGYLYDRRLALKTGKASTGNGRRESYEFPPLPRMCNTFIVSGSSPPEEIIRSVERGLLVKRMGGGEVNTVTGDFVFEVDEGYLIEKGKAGEPVRGATIQGNGPAVLRRIDMVGSDLGWGLGTCGKDGQGVPVADAQPTIRIPEIVVGGRVDK